MGVVPDTQMEFEVDHAAYHKLNDRDGSRADQAFQPERGVREQMIDGADGEKAKSAGQRHSPVGPAAVEQLQQGVERRPKAKEEQCLKVEIHSGNHPVLFDKSFLHRKNSDAFSM